MSASSRSSKAFALALAAAATIGASSAGAEPIVVGGKAFTEQYVLAEITKQMLERAGIEAVTRVGYATDAIRKAQLAGEVHVSWDYTWTGWAFHHGLEEQRPADEIMAELRELDAEVGLVWGKRSRVNNTYSFAVNLDFAAESCIHSLSDLAEAMRNGLEVSFASDQECHKREDCLLVAQRTYGFEFPKDGIQVMNVADTYEALRERRAEVAVVYQTDGKIPAYDLELLEDPKAVFAEYWLVPVARADTLASDPRIGPILDRIADALDRETSQELHYRVDVVGQPPEEVAAYFISVKNL